MKNRLTSCIFGVALACLWGTAVIAQEAVQGADKTVVERTRDGDKKPSDKTFRPSEESLARWKDSKRPKPTEFDIAVDSLIASKNEVEIRSRLVQVESLLASNEVLMVQFKQALAQGHEKTGKDNEDVKALEKQIEKLEKDLAEKINAIPAVSGANAKMTTLMKEHEELSRRHKDVFAQLQVAREEKNKGDSSAKRIEEIKAIENQLKDMDSRLSRINTDEVSVSDEFNNQLHQAVEGNQDAEAKRLEQEIQGLRDSIREKIESNPEIAGQKKAYLEYRAQVDQLTRQRNRLQKALKDVQAKKALEENANKAST